MKNLPAFLLLMLASPSVRADFHNESDLGIVVTSGNSKSQNYSFKQLNTYDWGKNLAKLQGGYLRSVSSGVESALQWNLGTRYERELAERFSLFAGESVYGDRYAGYLQRYFTDLGGKYYFAKKETWYALGEAGYRFKHENPLKGPKTNEHQARLYAEGWFEWRKGISSKLWAEYLPNFTTSEDWQLNSEASISAMLTEIFSLKTAYLVKYDHLPTGGAAYKTDSTFTTALVAKF